MRQWKLWLILGAIFISGLVAGAAGTGLVVQYKVKQALNQIITGESDQVAQVVMSHLVRALDLDEQQGQALEPVVARAVEEVRQVRIKLRPEFLDIYQRTVSDMDPILKEAQRKKLREILGRALQGLRGPAKEAAQTGQ